MLNRIIRFLRGYLRIRISGDSVERFINACSHRGICLWNLTNCKSRYEANITIRDFRKLKPVIRKTRTKVTIMERTGFPFFIQKYHHRKLFLPGFFICIFSIYILSTFIWSIQIKGNMVYTSENIKEFLKTLNIETGVKRNEIDCFQIAREIRRNYDNIIWVSASLEGTNLIIQVKENDETIKQENEVEVSDIPYDIVADTDCQITKIITRKGISQVDENTNVKEGELLVSGQIPILNDAKEIIDYHYCIADADIYGKKKMEYADEIQRTYYQKEFLNIEKQQYLLKIARYRFSLGNTKNNYNSFDLYSRIYKWGNISFEIKKAAPYEQIEKSYTNKQMQQLLSLNFQYYCGELEKKGVVILENDVKIYTWSDKAVATGNLVVEMPVGQIVKAEVIEIGEIIDGNDGDNN